MTVSRDRFVEGVLHGANRGIGASLLRGLLTPFALLHQIGLEAYLLPYNTGLRKRFQLIRAEGQPVPVVAIGNLSSAARAKPRWRSLWRPISKNAAFASFCCRGDTAGAGSRGQCRVLSATTKAFC